MGDDDAVFLVSAPHHSAEIVGVGWNHEVGEVTVVITCISPITPWARNRANLHLQAVAPMERG